MNKYDKIKYWIIDVDGTMTDGGIYYDEHGNEIKKFCTKDAAGFFAAHAMGMKIAVLTGRECQAVVRRMKEMNVEYIFQNVKNKRSFLEKFMQEHGLHKQNIAYIGDDLNDYSAMQLAGVIACPKDSCKEIKKNADYISNVKGGNGAVRDIICYVLKQRHEWKIAISRVYDM